MLTRSKLRCQRSCTVGQCSSKRVQHISSLLIGLQAVDHCICTGRPKLKSKKLSATEINTFLAALRKELKGFTFTNQHEAAEEITEAIAPTINKFFTESRKRS